MVRNNLVFLLIWLNMSVQASMAQTNRYMVFFTDKSGSNHSIDNPETFLSPRAMERRKTQNIPVTEEDLPVSLLYIDTLENIDGISVYHKTKWLNGVLVESPESQIHLAEDLIFVSKVEYVAPGQRLTRRNPGIAAGMDDKSLARMSEIANALQNNMLGIEEMHDAGYTGKGKMIGIFDAGFTGTNVSSFFNRLFGNDQVVATWNFVENVEDVFRYDDHGTSVLSTISGYVQEEYVGIAPDSEVILCITEDVPTEFIIEEYNWLFAAEFADSAGVDIINTSLGYNTFDDPSMDHTYEEMDGNTTIITRATDIAASKGILCVVSVGNEGNKAWGKMVAPADADSVLAVGAVNENMEYVSFSSTGPTPDQRIKPEVSALGQGTVIIGWDGQITYGSGTSYASPLIAGLAAGVWQAYPDLSNIELMELIKKGSSQFYTPDTLLGYGIPNFKTIQSEITALDDDLSDKGFKIYPNPVMNRMLLLEMTNDVAIQTDVNIEIYDLNGANVFHQKIKRLKVGDRHEMNLKQLSPGVYLLHVFAKDETGIVKILVP